MKIYTSYFAKAGKFDSEKYALIGIAGKSPTGWKMAKTHPGLEYKRLAPSWDIWKTWHDAMEKASSPEEKEQACQIYTDRFNKEILGNLNAEFVLWDLFDLAGDKDIVLICYEKPGDFCHRHLVADWLNKTNLVEVEEYEFG